MIQLSSQPKPMASPMMHVKIVARRTKRPEGKFGPATLDSLAFQGREPGVSDELAPVLRQSLGGLGMAVPFRNCVGGIAAGAGSASDLDVSCEIADFSLFQVFFVLFAT